MSGRVRRFVRDVLGRSDEATIELVRDQLDTVRQISKLIHTHCHDGGDVADLSGPVEELEAKGDRQRTELTRVLSSSLTTPIDREDIARLSRSIDDVLNNLRDFVREYELYAAPDPDAFVEMFDAIGHAIEVLDTAIAALADGPELIVQAAKDAERASEEIRRAYDKGLADLFEKPVDAALLRQRELFRRLDVVGLRLGEAASTLGDGGLKRIS